MVLLKHSIKKNYRTFIICIRSTSRKAISVQRLQHRQKTAVVPTKSRGPYGQISEVSKTSLSKTNFLLLRHLDYILQNHAFPHPLMATHVTWHLMGDILKKGIMHSQYQPQLTMASSQICHKTTEVWPLFRVTEIKVFLCWVAQILLNCKWPLVQYRIASTTEDALLQSLVEGRKKASN